MAHVACLDHLGPRASARFEQRPHFDVKFGAHALSIAKFCDSGKQHFAAGAADHRRMDERPINEVIADALAYYMDRGGWNKSTLGKAAGVAPNTIGNALNPSKRAQGKSGKAPSIKATELALIAKPMGLKVADLVTDLPAAERLQVLRARAAEHYKQHGRLPPWAPGPDDGSNGSTPTAASGKPPRTGTA